MDTAGLNPVVIDDLLEAIPVTAGEIDAIETYLGPLLDQLLHHGPPDRRAQRDGCAPEGGLDRD